MSESIRVIARLDIKGPNLVKGVHLEGLRVLGKPERFAQIYYEQGIDELIYLDVVASLYGRNSILDIIKKTSKNIFIPLTVGGGLRTVEDIEAVLKAGADKVAVNTAAIRTPELIEKASKKFGCSTIVVSIAAVRDKNGQYKVMIENGREKTDIDAFKWAIQVAELGAGEILITSIDQEGTGSGFDMELSKKISELVPIPVIANGGAGKVEHIESVINYGMVQAVSMASALHYNLIKYLSSNDDYSDEGNIEYLKSGKDYFYYDGMTVKDIKTHLIKSNIECRI